VDAHLSAAALRRRGLYKLPDGRLHGRQVHCLLLVAGAAGLEGGGWRVCHGGGRGSTHKVGEVLLLLLLLLLLHVVGCRGARRAVLRAAAAGGEGLPLRPSCTPCSPPSPHHAGCERRCARGHQGQDLLVREPLLRRELSAQRLQLLLLLHVQLLQIQGHSRPASMGVPNVQRSVATVAAVSCMRACVQAHVRSPLCMPHPVRFLHACIILW